MSLVGLGYLEALSLHNQSLPPTGLLKINICTPYTHIFLRAGDPDIIMNYEVNTLREGRSFAQRIVSAYQSDKLVFI